MMRIHSEETLKKNRHHRMNYAIEALKEHKKSSVLHKEKTASLGLQSIHNKTMSDYTMLYWADKHRARLINEREIAKQENVCV